ncbi:MAG: hypothetical protein Q4A05_09280 [Ruminococcus sp.]|nr:hypothetical protein [Ruminococcus sp.]
MTPQIVTILAVTPQMRNLLITLGAIAVILVLVILLFGGRSPFMRFMNLFLEENGGGGGGAPTRERRYSRKPAEDESAQKKTSEPIVEMATLIRKSDDRLRVIESTGQQKLMDEYYELMFVTRKGQKLKIECSREAYEKIPFNQQGSLTYKRNTLVKFKYYEDTVYNN